MCNASVVRRLKFAKLLGMMPVKLLSCMKLNVFEVSKKFKKRNKNTKTDRLRNAVNRAPKLTGIIPVSRLVERAR